LFETSTRGLLIVFPEKAGPFIALECRAAG
jgi:hypothetical protein